MTIQEFSEQVTKSVYKSEQIDPFTIMMIITLITNIVTVLQQCQTEDQIVKKAKKPSRLDRIIIRRIVNQHLIKSKIKSEKKLILNSVLHTAKTTPENDIRTLYQENNK